MPTGTTWETSNDVCPEGYRIPTDTEMQSLIAVGSQWTTQNGVNGRIFGSGDNIIFLPAVGGRNSSGDTFIAGTYGYYWSSTQFAGAVAHILYFYSSYVSMSLYTRDFGFSVRCVAE